MQEQDYILRFQNGDFDAFGSLYETYVDQIYAYILRKTSDREVAEDLGSQVWMKAMKGLEKYSEQDGASFKSWIYRIASNIVIDFYRSKKEESSMEEITEMGISEDFSQIVDNKDMLSRIRKFLKELTSIEEEIVVLRIWDDLSYREIAELTGKKEGNCKQIFKRTLAKIQANISLLSVIIFFI